MAVHDLLRELVETRGAGVVADADQFRGALDDFLDEHEASRGEINLLVDAVRLGAVTRLVAMLDHGADPAAALDEVAVELARDRGADSATGARWALGVIGYALGRIPAGLVASARPASVPAPQRPATPSPAPPVPEVSTEPTEPPSPSTPPPAAPPEPAPPLPERPPVPPTDVAPPPAESGTMTMPEHPTERVPADPSAPPPAGPVPPAAARAGQPGPPPFVAPPSTPTSSGGRRRLVAVLVAVLLVAAVAVAGFLLLSGDDPDEVADDPGSSASPDDDGGGDGGSASPSEDGSEDSGGGTAGPDALPAESVVLPVTVDGDTSLYVLDTTTGEASLLSQGVDDRLPNVSPDRSTVVFLRPEQRGTGLRSPYLLDVATGEERPLFDDASPCRYSGRPAWSPGGAQLAVTCVGEDGGYTGTFVVGLDGRQQQEVLADGVPEGGLTWSSGSTLIYSRSDGSGAPTTLWQYDLGDDSSTSLTSGPGWDTHPDWSEENGVALFQRSAEDGPDVRGELWTWSPYEGERLLEIGQPVAHGALSADGSTLFFVLDTDAGERLASAPFTDPSDLTVYEEIPGEPGAPAGGPL